MAFEWLAQRASDGFEWQFYSGRGYENICVAMLWLAPWGIGAFEWQICGGSGHESICVVSDGQPNEYLTILNGSFATEKDIQNARAENNLKKKHEAGRGQKEIANTAPIANK